MCAGGRQPVTLKEPVVRPHRDKHNWDARGHVVGERHQQAFALEYLVNVYPRPASVAVNLRQYPEPVAVLDPCRQCPPALLIPIASDSYSWRTVASVSLRIPARDWVRG